MPTKTTATVLCFSCNVLELPPMTKTIVADVTANDIFHDNKYASHETRN